ncbi:DUF4166 domain-containing protein [uncultured Microbacterium sp.]|uniref:DUF4166 domain-containing protein n=1 Tax=uncultured Microbacterium sp. TaxID=191216 RepID=UPI0035C9F87E
MYQRVLGPRFKGLDPQLQRYFGAIPAAFEGRGVGRYERAGLRRRILRPVFAILGWRHIAFSESGSDVPFTVQNVAQPDGSLSATRTFEFARGVRTMRDRMRVVEGRLIDRIGTRGEIEVEFAVDVVRGGLRMQSRRIALRLGRVRLPLAPLVRVVIEERAVRGGCGQRVDVRMLLPLVGEIYGYSGGFIYSLVPKGTIRGT